ncbi:unnamed protein product, partial [Nesidiocoris tenuis]
VKHIIQLTTKILKYAENQYLYVNSSKYKKIFTYLLSRIRQSTVRIPIHSRYAAYSHTIVFQLFFHWAIKPRQGYKSRGRIFQSLRPRDGISFYKWATEGQRANNARMTRLSMIICSSFAQPSIDIDTDTTLILIFVREDRCLRNQPGKVVLVTGAGSSVGSEIVRHFSKLGASVVMIDGDRDLQIKVSQESGSSCLAVAGSHTKAMDVINVISQTISKYRKLDSLINCIDFPECGSSEKETSLLQEYDRVMGYTGRAVYNIVLLAAPHLTKSKGSVVNVINLSGTESLANSVALASLEQLTKSLAEDLAPNGVRVNEITFDFSQVRDAGAESDEKSATDSAQDNIAEHESVAESAAFLVSDAASYIIGASLPLSRSKHSATVVDGIKTSAMPNNEKPGHSKEGNSVHKASGNPNHKVDHASDQGGKDECSIHKSETANFKKDNKPESNSDHKVSDSKSEKAQKHESDKKSKDDKRTDSENNVKHSNGAVPGKHEEDNNAKHVKNGNQGGDHKVPQKNEQLKNDHGKFTK